METAEFLKATVTGGAGHFVMAYRNHTDPWTQEWYTWPMDLSKIVARSEAMKATHDVYFTSYLFTDRSATRAMALPTSTIQADLDRADLSALPVTPSLLVETSPKHYHAYWLLNQQLSKTDHERLSKRMTYSIPDADHTGWAIGHRLRVANTLNHKYLNPDGTVRVYEVHVLSAPLHKYAAEDIELLPDPPVEMQALTDEDAEHDPFLAAAIQGKIDVGIGHLQLLESIKDRIPISVYIAEAQQTTPQPDRSAALWSLMCSCFNAGLAREAVYWLAYNSPNNKFKQDQRYHAELDLALDVQRAERHVKQATFDARAMIDVLRQHKGKPYAKHRGIASVVRDVMHTEGEFIKTFAGDVWYLPNSTGKPMEVSTRDHGLNALLDLRYGLNPTELEQSYVVESLITNTASLPETASTAILSHYDINNNAVLLHTGHRNIMKVSAEAVTHQKNGGNNVLFTWESIFETFSPAISSNSPGAGAIGSPGGSPDAGLDWGKELFGPLDTITNMAPEEARCILKVWFMFLLFRNAAESRPILAFFGSPGSGKTSIMRRIYRLLYAKRLAVSGLTSAEDYDHSSAKVPFLALDNADSYTSWLPDKLAQSIGDIDTLRRKLYSNGQIVRMRKQALVGVTAHAPKFTVNRPDVADRLLLMNFKRVEKDHFMAEGLVYWRIDAIRDQLWGAIVFDLQTILRQGTPKPHVQTSMRVQDFAWLGEWIASGLDTTGQHLAVFRTAIGNTLLSQSSLILQDDEALITSLSIYVQATGGTHGQYITSTELYQRVLDNCTETHRLQFQKAVRSSKVFGSKIFNMYHILSNLFDITYEEGMVIRTWNIAPKTSLQES